MSSSPSSRASSVASLKLRFHRIAFTQDRIHPPAKAHLERKQTEGKSRREALRCLKRQLARTI